MSNERILIVEDESLIAIHLQVILEQAGYAVVSMVTSGEEAIQKVKDVKPDIVLMDIVLEGEMNGIEAAEIIHSDFDIPVIYLTAHGEDKVFERAKSTEPYGYIIKPFKKEELKKTIEIALYKHKIEKERKELIQELREEITERVLVEKGLLESEEKYRQVIATARDAIMVFDAKTRRFIEINKACEDIYGYSREEFINMRLADITITAEPEDSEVSFSKTPIKKLPKISLYYHRKKDGTVFPVEISESNFIYKGRNVLCVIIRDITERIRFEEEKQNMQLKMIQSSKLASLGEIATGIAHEINQPLTYISTFIQNLQEDIEDNTIDETKLEERLKTANNQADRINKIIQHLRTFSRQDIADMRPVSIETIFNNTLLLMGERIRLSNIDLVNNIEPDLPVVLGNPNRLEEVFINMLQKSIDAFTNNSKNARISVNMNLSEDKESIIIRVTDNGIGIEYEKQEKIFEPFFTTKEIGKGTGLGLSIVYGIIREHKGSITCQSEPNKGTAFTITLPVSADK